MDALKCHQDFLLGEDGAGMLCQYITKYLAKLAIDQQKPLCNRRRRRHLNVAGDRDPPALPPSGTRNQSAALRAKVPTVALHHPADEESEDLLSQRRMHPSSLRKCSRA